MTGVRGSAGAGLDKAQVPSGDGAQWARRPPRQRVARSGRARSCLPPQWLRPTVRKHVNGYCKVDLSIDGERGSRALERGVASRVHGVARELVQRIRVQQKGDRSDRRRKEAEQHRAGDDVHGRPTSAGSLTDRELVYRTLASEGDLSNLDLCEASQKPHLEGEGSGASPVKVVRGWWNV